MRHRCLAILEFLLQNKLNMISALLPLPLIQSLNLRYRREKAGLLCMFLLGSLTISASIVRFAVQDIIVNNLPTCK